MNAVSIHTDPEYTVTIGGGLLAAVGTSLRRLLPEAEKLAVVTDDNVSLLWADPLEDSLRAADYEPVRFVLPHGEAQKSPEHYFALLNFLAEEGLSRTDAVLALGGGMICDLAGFAAATFLRGIPLVMLPTTLLAMADAAVGGKTGIDLAAGKNLVGAFYQPAAVFCDTDTLKTLPAGQFSEGCAEVLKCAVICDRPLFDRLLSEGRGFPRKETVSACVRIKADFVAADVRDTGCRKMLNLGHTLGHAAEAHSRYTISHGCAVAMGLAAAARVAQAHGICGADCPEEIRKALTVLKLPAELPYRVDELLPYLLSDKKRRGSRIDLILPEAVGRCRVEPVEASELAAYLKAGLE